MLMNDIEKVLITKEQIAVTVVLRLLEGLSRRLVFCSLDGQVGRPS